HHMAADLIGVAKKFASPFNIRIGQRMAQFWTGVSDTVGIQNVTQRLYLKAKLHTGIAQQGDIAASIAAEAEVFADVKPLDRQLAHQDVFYKLLRRLLGKGLIKSPDMDMSDAATGQGAHFVSQG